MSCPLSVSRMYRVSSSAKPSSRTICQSAPPGSTLPLIPGPEKVPPRIGTIRRRPSGTSPISTGGPTCARTSNTNVSFGPLISLIKCFEPILCNLSRATHKSGLPFASRKSSPAYFVADRLENLPCFRFGVVVEQIQRRHRHPRLCVVHVGLRSEIGRFVDFGRYYAYPG